MLIAGNNQPLSAPLDLTARSGKEASIEQEIQKELGGKETLYSNFTFVECLSSPKRSKEKSAALRLRTVLPLLMSLRLRGRLLTLPPVTEVYLPRHRTSSSFCAISDCLGTIPSEEGEDEYVPQ